MTVHKQLLLEIWKCECNRKGKWFDINVVPIGKRKGPKYLGMTNRRVKQTGI